MLANDRSRAVGVDTDGLYVDPILMQKSQQIRRAFRVRNGERHGTVVFHGPLLNVQRKRRGEQQRSEQRPENHCRQEGAALAQILAELLEKYSEDCAHLAYPSRRWPPPVRQRREVRIG
jgi:hypothetical protein